ncbi:MAG: hypothetical protein IJF59_03680 [Clostridia bacterium]|nr:hypothetical protein [Clostridia bacterium]MBQ7023034.1 hypothetical protein [Akkermansia sp.]
MESILTPDLIRATARCYTRQELLEKLRDACERLGSGSLITTAASGTGTSYTRTITLSPADAVALYEAAIQYLDSTTTPESTLTTRHFISHPCY